MTVRELLDKGVFDVVNEGEDVDREISVPFCCDLLSIAMGRATAGCAWVTMRRVLLWQKALCWMRRP